MVVDFSMLNLSPPHKLLLLFRQIQIVKSMSQIPQHLFLFFYPVIQTSTNIKEPSHIYLLEEGLELWLHIVETSNALSQELLDLSPNILSFIGKVFIVPL